MTPESLGSGRWPHVVSLPVLGVWTRFDSDSEEVIRWVREVYGSWADLEGEEALLTPSAGAVKIAVEEDPNEVASGGGAPRYYHRVPDPSRLIVFADGGAGLADTGRLESLAYVQRRLLRWPREFTEGLLEPLTLFLVGAQDRQPLHAAAVERDGTAILLAGPSGVGKSTVVYAALRNGFRVLADEPVYVQLQPRLRVWGRRARLHLSADAARHFPELQGMEPILLPTGKTKIVVEEPLGGVRHAERTALCLLSRRAGAPSLEPATPDEAVGELASSLDPGFDLFADTIGERIRWVAEGGAWRLTLGDSPADAIRLLEEVIAGVERES